MCVKCALHIKAGVQASTEEDTDMEVTDLETGVSREDTHALYGFRESTAGALNVSLTEAGFSPIKVSKLSRRDVVGYGKRKAVEAEAAAHSQLATSLDISPVFAEQEGSERL